MSYDPKFLGKNLSTPKVTRRKRHLIKLDYTHFSILYDKSRLQPACTMVNIDGMTYKQSTRGNKDKWMFEKKINKEEQLGDWFYKNSGQRFHRGHLVRRLDPCWGSEKKRKMAEDDTFHFTNASPQHKLFNPKIWLELEKHVLENAAAKGKQRMSVFAGPILLERDLFFKETIDCKYVQLPVSFWKLIVWQRSDKKLSAVCFIQSQLKYVRKVLRSFKEVKRRGLVSYDRYLENIKFKNGTSYQVTKGALEKATGFQFNWKEVIFPYKQNKYREIKKPRKKRSGARRSASTGKTTLNVVLE